MNHLTIALLWATSTMAAVAIYAWAWGRIVTRQQRAAARADQQTIDQATAELEALGKAVKR